MSTKRHKRRKRNLKKLTLAILLFFIINEKKHLILPYFNQNRLIIPF